MSSGDRAPAWSNWSSIGLDLVTLRLFISAAEESSFAGAAERENISLSAVSRRISHLEARLGLTFFNRHDRGVTLTVAGNALLGHMRNISSLLETMTLDLEMFRGGTKGCVRIQTIYTHLASASSRLPELLSSFREKYPEIELEIQEQVAPDVVQAVRTGVADVGLSLATIAADDLETFEWAQDELVAIVPVNHRLASRSAVTLADLASETFVVIKRETAFLTLYYDMLRTQGASPSDRIHVASSISVCNLVAAGMGVAIIPAPLVDVKFGSKITRLRLDESWSKRSLVICIRNRGTLSIAAKLFVDFIGGHS